MAARPLEIGAAGLHAAQAVARLREARGWDQGELTARLAAAGRQVSQPIVSRIEAGTRRIDADDLVALAATLDVPVAALLPRGDGVPVRTLSPAARDAELADTEPTFRHPVAVDGESGPVLAALAEDVAALGDLVGMEPTLAEVAYRLARQMDGLRPVPCDDCGTPVHIPADPRILPQLAKELRATVAALLEGRAPDDDDDGLGDLGDA